MPVTAFPAGSRPRSDPRHGALNASTPPSDLAIQ
jgi:hypothetical protein